MPPYPAHPREVPRVKHKLYLPGPLPSSSDELLMIDNAQSSNGEYPHLLDTPKDLFRALDRDQDHPEFLQSMTHLADVYTYPDGPSSNMPLAISLQVVGYAPIQLQAVCKLHDASLTKRKEWCSIGVHRADDSYGKQLPSVKRDNSNHFSKLLQYLYEVQAVAVIQLDNKGRVGTLSPFPKDMREDGMPPIAVGKRGSYVGRCCFRSIQEWKALVEGGFSHSSSEAVSSFSSQKMKTQHTGDDDNGPTFQPGGEYDDGPSFRPDNDDQDTPLFQPDDGGDDSAPLWNPGGNGDSGGGGMDSSDAAPLWTPDNGDSSNGGGGMDSSDAAPLWMPDGGGDDKHNSSSSGGGTISNDASALWSPGGDEGGFGSGGGMAVSDASNLWAPDGGDGDTAENYGTTDDNGGFDTSFVVNIDSTGNADNGGDDSQSPNNNYNNDNEFHADSTAQQADAFYSGLKRDMKSRAESRLYHMRSFNGWCKAMQIVELNPLTRADNPDAAASMTATGNNGNKKRRRNGGGGLQPIRVLDLACGKGGDLLKWVNYYRGVSNYVGVDVARGSLRDAAERVQKLGLSKLPQCSFVCADLGYDVVGSAKEKHKLLTWRLTRDTLNQSVPQFDPVVGGGVKPQERFDVISVQFAIHYMMSTRQRARRFFKTVGDLLDVGGNLIATTIDARVILQHIMGMGIDWFRFMQQFNEDGRLKDDADDEPIVVKVGGGACRLKFDRTVVKRLFETHIGYNDEGSSDRPPVVDPTDERNFGLTYTFTLVEGEDHAAGVGEAVDLPEWLSPIPMLAALAAEAGLEVESVENFHEFFKRREDVSEHGEAHNAMYKMHVLNREGSISEDEWEISRLYMAIKFTKVREVHVDLGEEDDAEDKDEEEPHVDDDVDENVGWQAVTDPEAEERKAAPKDPMKVAMATKKAKSKYGAEAWANMSSKEKTEAMEMFYA
jgi:mRNA (guanine-N7-)-methyltransferase